MKHTLTKLLALFLCLITLLSFVPAVASADEEPFQQTVTIESEKNNAFDYLEYYNGSKWKDLNTPKHWVESTGQVCYCIEHTDGNPHGATYTATAPSQVFGANTLAGLQTILMYGYPCNTPEGFTEDEARQATANAIRLFHCNGPLSLKGGYPMLNFNQAIDTNYPRSKIPMILTMLDLLYVLSLGNGTVNALRNDETFPIIDLNGQKYVLRNSLFEWLKQI